MWGRSRSDRDGSGVGLCLGLLDFRLVAGGMGNGPASVDCYALGQGPCAVTPTLLSGREDGAILGPGMPSQTGSEYLR